MTPKDPNMDPGKKKPGAKKGLGGIRIKVTQ
jgi:hypothetical protein